MPKKKQEQKSAPKPKPEGYVFGRPTMYTDELATRICREIASSTDGLKKICANNEGFPVPKTIYEWRIDNRDFSDKYDAAKRLQADLLASEIMDIADDSARDNKLNATGDIVCDSEWVSRSRLRVDTRKWIASKLLPKVYGDQTKIENLEGENLELKKELMELRGELDAKHRKEY